MSRLENTRRGLLSVAALVAAGAIAVTSADSGRVQPSPLHVDWVPAGSSSPAGQSSRACDEQAPKAQGPGVPCPVEISFAPKNTLGVAATGLLPGSTAQRAVDVRNDGRVQLAQVTVAVASSTSSPLTDGSATGLQLRVDRCATSWTEDLSSAVTTYSCGATPQSVVSERPVPASPVALAASPALAPGGIDHLRITLRFPSNAGLSAAGRSTRLTYSFTAVQRTGKA